MLMASGASGRTASPMVVVRYYFALFNADSVCGYKLDKRRCCDAARKTVLEVGMGDNAWGDPDTPKCMPQMQVVAAQRYFVHVVVQMMMRCCISLEAESCDTGMVWRRRGTKWP